MNCSEDGRASARGGGGGGMYLRRSSQFCNRTACKRQHANDGSVWHTVLIWHDLVYHTVQLYLSREDAVPGPGTQYVPWYDTRYST